MVNFSRDFNVTSFRGAITRSVLLSAIIGLFLCSSGKLSAQAAITEKWLDIPTYRYYGAEAVPNPGIIYPYHRYNHYSSKGSPQQWKVIEMENPRIRVTITPQIGGKVWGAVEKKTGLSFIYSNDAVKFRDIALRGPWTSGGIEFNFGVIGHTPAGAERVEYLTRTAPDGAAECVIGGLDLASRTEWRVIIRLPRDAAWFETRCLWWNPTPLHQSGYHWTNAGAEARGDLVFYYPGTHYIGHDGAPHSWPLDEQGRSIDTYAGNNFGSYKSYHVLGLYTDFFGGYWKSRRFGFGHWSPYWQKPGKKLWIWGLSRQGMIWEDMLTDHSGQYIEFQSGRMLNQPLPESSLTPFKNSFLQPVSFDEWREVWFPFRETDGMVKATPRGVLNAERQNGALKISFCALEHITHDELIVSCSLPAGNRQQPSTEHRAFPLNLQPMDVSHLTLPDPGEEAEIGIRLKNGGLSWSNREKETHRLDRPLENLPGFNPDLPESQFIMGEEAFRRREYESARRAYESCLRGFPHHVMALTRLAELYYRDARYDESIQYSRNALAVETSAPAANFIHGLALAETGRYPQAMDAFGWAMRSMEFRSAAALAMAEIQLRLRQPDPASDFAQTALDYNRYNLPALQILALVSRLAGDNEKAAAYGRRIRETDPLNFFAHCEEYFMDPNNPQTLARLKSPDLEFPHERYLETALSYFRWGQLREARLILQFSHETPVILYWRAFLSEQLALPGWRNELEEALAASPHLVFPFRRETASVLEWAQKQLPHWKNHYYRALIHWNSGFPDAAAPLLASLEQQPDYDIFYLTRARLTGALSGNPADPAGEKDLRFAVHRWPLSYFAHRERIRFLLDGQQYREAETAAQNALKRFRDDLVLSMNWATALLKNEKFDRCLDILKRLRVLPCEGAKEAHDIHRAAWLMKAVDAIRAKKFQQARQCIAYARLWPENLGAGQPYDPPEQLENYLQSLINASSNNPPTPPGRDPGAPDAELIRSVLERLHRK